MNEISKCEWIKAIKEVSKRKDYQSLNVEEQQLVVQSAKSYLLKKYNLRDLKRFNDYKEAIKILTYAIHSL